MLTKFSPANEQVTRAYLHTLMTHKEAAGCSLLTVHNVAFQLRLMRKIRESIQEDKFPQFIQKFFEDNFPQKDYPQWALDALLAVGVTIN